METRIVKNEISRDKLKTLVHEQYGRVSKERWWTLTLAEQFGNIGSEVGRDAKWQGRDENSFWGAVTRALELLDLTRTDKRWKNRRREIDRAKEVFCDAVLGGREYNSSLPDLERYFMPFAFLASSRI